ncbi:MAG TPA: universal stress protein [Longimicrobiales bacterium]|nr:universal stress protein [Longimicrobiales bacterium]
MARRTGAIRNILVATDLQADSRAGVEMAGAIAAAAGARVHLFHVLEDAADARGSARAALLEQRAADARRALDVQAQTLKDAGVRVGSVARAKGGPAHRKILARLERTEADLVVLGSHSREGPGRRLGSTADRVLRTSPVPCLVVRGESRSAFRRVAALVDFSRVSRNTLRLAVDWLPVFPGAGQQPALEIVHVGDGQLRALDPTVEGLLASQLERERETARKRAEGARLSTRLLWGRHPAAEVMAAAADGAYDLIVVGTHGRGPLVRALIGSVALALAQSAPCPVLVVPPGS